MRGKARTTLLAHSAGLVDGNAAGESWNHIYQTSVVKHPDYNIGDRVCLPDGRVFRYARVMAGQTVVNTMGVKAYDEEIIKYASIAASAAVGANAIVVTVAATDGSLGAAAIAEDELRGGHVVIKDGASDTVRQHRGIVGNTAMTAVLEAQGSPHDRITLYLDGGLDTAITTTNAVQVLGNIYRNTRWWNEGWTSILGVPMRAATALQYYWMQTWGPICIKCTGAGIGGPNGGEERQAVFGANGGVHEHDSTAQQHAGFVIQRDAANADGPPFIMLQINP